MLRIISIALVLMTVSAAIIAQSVTIVPKRTVYRRPKPMVDFKKTFVIRRPVARVKDAALARKITTAISPESVLGLKVSEELGEYQWLEQADYKVLYNDKGVLCIESWMEGTAAYPDSVTHRVVVDARTGRKATAAQSFTFGPGLISRLKKMQRAEIDRSVAEMKKDPENRDVDPAELFAEADLRGEDLTDFSVSQKGVTFYYDYGFPHVLQALQPPGEYFVAWAKLKPYIRPGSLLERFVN
jgi:hypothetical protein